MADCYVDLCGSPQVREPTVGTMISETDSAVARVTTSAGQHLTVDVPVDNAVVCAELPPVWQPQIGQ